MGGGHVSQIESSFCMAWMGPCQRIARGSLDDHSYSAKSSLSATEMTSRGPKVSLLVSSKCFAVRDMRKQNRWCD